jgi:hypothetical protein
VKAGTITPAGRAEIVRESRRTGLMNSLIHAPVDQVLAVYQDENTTDQERQQIRPLLLKKIRDAKLQGEQKAGDDAEDRFADHRAHSFTVRPPTPKTTANCANRMTRARPTNPTNVVQCFQANATGHT